MPKITDLTELTAPASDDVLPIDDISSSATKKITFATMAANIIPAGVINIFSTNSAPTGWLICDGSAVSRSTYDDLFAVISTTYGVGDGSTTFNLPSLKGKVPVGRDSGQTEFDTLAETSGAKTHTLSSSEMPAHTHSVNPPSTSTSTGGSHSHTYGPLGTSGSYGILDSQDASSSGTGNTGSSGSHSHTVNIAEFTSGSTGSTGAHNNLQPYIVLNYIIKT